MKLFKDKLNNDQPKRLSSRDEKKSVNIRWNSKLFFQFGLIISLLIVYSVMQAKFEIKEKAIVAPKIDYLEEPPMIMYILEEPKKIEKEKLTIKKPKTKERVIVKEKILENVTVSETNSSNYKESNTKEDINSENPTTITKRLKVNKTYNLIGVEHVPVFPGCEYLSSNIEKRNCMSLKIKKFIQKKFNTDKFDNINTMGKQTITVQFYIDENGNVSDIMAKAIDKSLEKEAIRVISKLPKMKPGRQGGKEVKVQYMIPIVFNID